MPHEPIQIRATWIVAFPEPDYWSIEFDVPLLGSVGATDPARWSLLASPWIPPTSALVHTDGSLRLFNALYTGVESKLLYLGRPPRLSTLAGGILAAYQHDIP